MSAALRPPRRYDYVDDGPAIYVDSFATIRRETSESRVDLTIDLDGTGRSDVDTGVRFYDHMLLSFAKHSLIDLTVKAVGDVDVDAHHTVEDVAIVLGVVLMLLPERAPRAVG